MTEPNPRREPTSTAAPYPVELINVVQRFSDKVVLDGVNFRVARGEIGVVLGGSGAGKTTLMRVVIGLLRPDSGQVLIDGQDIAQMNERELHAVRSKFGMVFQYSALLDSLNVQENVALPLREHTDLSSKEIAARVKQLLIDLEIAGTEERFPAELSGGMRKRVGLARALIRQPQIVIYDEPASGLDPLTARLVDDLILKTRDNFGVTSLVISHDMTQAMKIADRLYLLEHGQVVADGPPREVISEAGSLAARFFQASGVSFGKLKET
jgi:phospholipid/cholesterol/gamma-HCH transport system ATP-binding protein